MRQSFVPDAGSCGHTAGVVRVAALIALMAVPLPLLGQIESPLQRIRSLGLDSVTVGRVTSYFAPGDSSHATELAGLADAAADYFASAFESDFALHLAVLQPNTWFDPYQGGAAAPYGMPWGWIPDSLMGVPASLSEGVLIVGPDEQANLRRVRFVMLHEYGHLAAKRYLHPQGDELYSSVRWFEELLATYFAYTFVQQSDAKWAQTGWREWVDFVQADPPPSATLDWSFMYRLPPQEFGRTYAWYQNLLNVRAAEIHSEHGLHFLIDLRDRLPWSSAEAWTTEMLLPLLDSVAPGFQNWAEGIEKGRYVARTE